MPDEEDELREVEAIEKGDEYGPRIQHVRLRRTPSCSFTASATRVVQSPAGMMNAWVVPKSSSSARRSSSSSSPAWSSITLGRIWPWMSSHICCRPALSMLVWRARVVGDTLDERLFFDARRSAVTATWPSAVASRR